uniref:Uncharacterized protein n=1 Tax=Peronospora matthiolae TaxID=2874970 RepID=A0AAV1TH47_9STRA
MDKMMAILGDISNRMIRLELSQREQAERDVREPSESFFNSVLGAGLTLKALDGDLPRKKYPTDFEARRQDFGYVGVHRGEYGGAEARMGAVPEPTNPRQETSPDIYPGVGMPDRFFADEDPQVYGMPDAKDRKLALQSFDVKELYL